MRIFSCFLLLLIFTRCTSYQALHKNSIVIDTHNDALSSSSMKGLDLGSDLSGKTHSDITRFLQGGMDIQVFSIFCDERFGKDTAFKYANREIDSLYAITARNSDRTMLVRTVADLQQAVSQKKLGCMMGVEGGHMIEDRMEYLDSFYKRGVRYMTLTWNNSTPWATSAMDETTKRDSLPRKGLTDFGKNIVRRMNALGMIVDISHVGEQTFWDAINTTTKPVIASHSCVYSLCPVFRNLKDEQIKAIGSNGGVIQLNFYSGFVDSSYTRRVREFNSRHRLEVDSLRKLKWPNYEIEEWMAKQYPVEAANLRPPLSMLLDHLDYIVRLIGADHVGLGSDFDGISSSPSPLDDVTSFPLITKALRERGYSKKDIKKILGENFIRVFKANEVKQTL
jgi:membrane dipeptidase